MLVWHLISAFASNLQRLNATFCFLSVLQATGVLLRHCVFSLEMAENKRPSPLYREHILFGSLRDVAVAAWLIARTTMDIFYNGRGGRHESGLKYIYCPARHNRILSDERRTSLFFLIFHRKLISRVSPSGRRALDPTPLSLLCSAY